MISGQSKTAIGIPNILTLTRLLLTPLFVIRYEHPPAGR
jgi:hypothetical protein